MARIRTFLVTGASSGLGKAIATQLLAGGQRVVGTFRRAEQLAEFDALAPGRAFGRLLDQADEDAIGPAIAAIEAEVGPIDVLVANAGYGHEGGFEESTMAELRAQFEVNVFGTVAVIKAALPGMRERRRGNIFVVTSMGGIVTFPGLSFYHGSKFALEGIVGALAQEVAGFGVHVTAIEPGSFRTDWAGRSMIRTPRSISDYDALFDPIRARRQANSGKQLGNPDLVAPAIMRVLGSTNPPVHLVLGSDALRLVGKGQDALHADIEAWADVSASTDFPDGASLGRDSGTTRGSQPNMTTTSQPAKASGQFPSAAACRSTGSASARCASPAPASGATRRPGRGGAGAAPGGRTGRRLHRHRRLLRPVRQRGADRRGAASVPGRPGHRHQGRLRPRRARATGRRSAGRNTCASRSS